MTVTIDPSDMRPFTSKARGTMRHAGRKILLAGIGGTALIAFTAGAFSFFNGLADPRAKTVRPSPVAASWPELKDGVPALAPRSVSDARKPVLATVLNLPRPDEAGPQRSTVGDMDFRLHNEPPALAESAPPASAQPESDAALVRSTTATAAPANLALDSAQPSQTKKTQASKPVPAVTTEAPRPAESAAALGSAASVRKPPIENAEIVTGEVETAPLIVPRQTVSVIAPSRSESVRARAAKPSAFVSLPAESSLAEAAQAEAAPMRIEQPKPVAAKPAAPKPIAAKAKPVGAAPAKQPVQKRVMQASAAPGAIPAAAAHNADDPEVMGVKIPGGRHVRDGWKAVFGGTGQN